MADTSALPSLALIAEQGVSNLLLTSANVFQRRINSGEILDQALAKSLIEGTDGKVIKGLNEQAFAVATEKIDNQPVFVIQATPAVKA